MSEIKHLHYENNTDNIFTLTVEDSSFAGVYVIEMPDNFNEVDCIVDISEDNFNIDKTISSLITFEKEKYKDFEDKDKIIANLIQELKNWKIIDYGSFIDKTLFQLKKDIVNPNISEDGKYYLLKNLPYYEDLKTNYNKVINEPKYA